MASENIYASDASLPPRVGMSGASKVLLGLGLGCGFLLLLACAGIVGVVWWLKSSQITDVAEIRRLTDEIVTIEMPAGFEPETAYNFKVPLAPSKAFVMVLWSHKHGHLALAQIAGASDEATINQLRMQMEVSLSQQTQREHVAVEKTEKHDTEIHGQPAHFTITTGKTAEGKEVREVTGDFLGSKGPALIFFVGDAEKFSEEAVIHMLDSMK